ncbi:hypothetical protein JIN84_10635 [Luteolibacter yonseiensis]|uniref:SCP domain-containing protein n=1 Tax=Luteolibacter yonseiensis TaxID=1144680 RepID=A0A934VC33_9BACT|nr:CAP domain-containing protein [Luteolibacter yonseiensis]MBK1816069.1 hypothetical protein [Luteolibacter yonseiensis]
MKKILIHTSALFASALIAQAQMSQYSHGNPTAEEQYMLELINRARAAPAAEGQFLVSQKNPDIKVAFDYFKVNLNRVKQDFSGYAVRPPLTFHPDLLAAARRHSTDMAKKNFQSHTGSDDSSPTGRVKAAGYDPISVNENIFSKSVQTPLYAHVGLNVDWGPYPNGVQSTPIHRQTIMGLAGYDFREIGIGIVARTGSNATKNGKFAITQNFASRQNSPNFLVGVVYSDTNGNGSYDPNEGLSGVKVTPQVGGWFAETSTSGGYAIPFPEAPGASSVVFSGGSLPRPLTRDFSLTDRNVKLDLRVASEQPVIRLQKVDSVAREGGPASGRTAVFRVVRAGSTIGDLRVDIGRSIDSGSGKASPKDYKISAVKPARVEVPGNKSKKFPVIIPAGADHADVKITAVGDKTTEPKEVVSFTLRSGTGYQVGTPTSVTISIKK